MGGRREKEAREIVDAASGRLKEATGAMTGDETLEAEGRSERGRAKRKTYRVMHRSDGEWEVRADDSERATSVHEKKDEAVDNATELAKNHKPSQMLVYKKDGTIQTERTYE